MSVVRMFQGILSRGTIMSRFIFSTVAIVGLLALSAGSAFAQHCNSGGYGGGHGGGYGGGYYAGNQFGVQVYSTPSYNYAPQYVSSGYQNYQPSYQNYQPSYQSYQPSYGGYSGGSFYHNTSHYDYHAPSLQRHGNHFDVVPGHYDYHRTGHFHRR